MGVMMMVEMVWGVILMVSMGCVFMHEHVFVLLFEIIQNYFEEWGDEDERVVDAVRCLIELKVVGIDIIVDFIVFGFGCYILCIVCIVGQFELNIVVVIGFYMFDNFFYYFGCCFFGIGFDGSDFMVNMFVRDIIQGIVDIGIKVGIIKCVIDWLGVIIDVERVLWVCVKMYWVIGVLIIIYIYVVLKRGLDQQRIFWEEGVDLSRVVIGYCGDIDDLDYLGEVLAVGSILGMDCFGIDGYLIIEKRVVVVVELCCCGYVDCMVLSYDCSCYLDWILGEVLLLNMFNWYYLYISRDVILMLHAVGVIEVQVDVMFVHMFCLLFEYIGLY